MKSHILKQEVIIWFDPEFVPNEKQQILISIRQPTGETVIGMGIYMSQLYFINALGTNHYVEIPSEVNMIAWCYPPTFRNMEN
jgi:hypothetical protein